MPSNPVNFSIESIIKEVEAGIQFSSAFRSYEIVDVTQATVKIKIGSSCNRVGKNHGKTTRRRLEIRLR